MNETTSCERVRLQVMASLDGETDAGVAPDTAHLSACDACREWLQSLQSIDAQLRGLPYQGAEIDVWTAVRRRMHQPAPRWSLTSRLLAIGVLVLTWRALQLLVDVPVPLLHPLVPIAAAIAALWQLAGDPLAIETFAPELQKEASDGIA